MARKNKTIDMRDVYIQSCIDCGFIPSKEKVRRTEKYWDISEIDWRAYENDRRN